MPAYLLCVDLFGLVLAVIGFIVASALTRMIRKPEEAIPAVA